MKLLQKRIVQGALVSLLVPLGWWCIQALFAAQLHGISGSSPILYAYLYVSACALLFFSGYLLAKKESYIKTLALYDKLTGVYNAQYFEARLKEEIKRTQRSGGVLAIVSFDLDHFKRVIDNHGDEVGDQVLQVIARCVRGKLRQHDVFARVGEEAFSILLPNCGLQSAKEKAEQLRRCISNTRIPLCDRKSLITTASFGVTQYLQSETEDSFRARADSAIIDAKYAGRNNTKVRTNSSQHSKTTRAPERTEA